MNEKYDIFISYSRKNSRFVKKLAADLEQHQISVWLDTQEIEVGDQFRIKIEEGIASSRYFCLVLSPASLKSFFVRKFELESAFTLMMHRGKESFILPIMLKRPSDPLPLMLASFHYLDFSRSSKYLQQLERLVKKIQLDNEDLTGAIWYKNIDVSPYGFLSGIGPLNHMSYSGTCVLIHFENGLGKKVETYTDGNQDGYKLFSFDSNNRVYENTLYRSEKIIDTWRYLYDPKTKLRTKKQVYIPGFSPHLEIDYDRLGNQIEERNLDQDGNLTFTKGFAKRIFEYKNGKLSKETWFDVDNSILRVIDK